ncbi:unnamed protein product [Penicillium olsonii]|uniref:FAD-binding PCMH-type domain-containing protein n=1 Tax=Penicillium olsonii TaxID=99116 RepID=A0A9W4HY60_PENOL|nr:unnamed protein product [Penicillium olsonii]
MCKTPILSTFIGVSSLIEVKGPSDPCWPTTEAWPSLNETVSGRLIKTVPPGSVCYKSEPNCIETSCGYLFKNWVNSEYHSSNPVTVLDPLWSNSSCTPVYPNGTSVSGDINAGSKGCSLGNLSPFAVNATTAQHVKAAIQFASKHKVRLNIKNTGHNPEKSSAYGSLSIWTHHIKGLEIHDSFTPSDCSSHNMRRAVTIRAGIQDGELLDHLAKHDLTTVTGTSSGVGVAGWATGSGHGVLTGTYGMGVDNIIEAHIVTPRGEAVIANDCQSKELFWAIGGGGGGTFGVILSLTMSIYTTPLMTTATVSMTARNGTSGKAWWKLVSSLHKQTTKLQDAGVMGYYNAGGSPYSFQYTMFQFNTTDTASIKHLIGPLEQLIQMHNQTVESSSMSSWLPVWSSIENLLEPRGDADSKSGDGVSDPSISGTMTISHKPVNNALNPAWWDGTVHLITSVQWDDTVPVLDAKRAIEAVIHNTGYAIRQLSPDSGTYDPSNLLWCRHCVGSESLQKSNGSLGRAF